MVVFELSPFRVAEMELQVRAVFSPSSTGSLLLQVQNLVCKNPYMLNFAKKNRFSSKYLRLENECYSKNTKRAVYCSSSANDSTILSNAETQNAKVIYSVAPAMGHNQEQHPECNSRVPAIVNALEKMELTSKFRCSDVVELQSLKPASVDDIASVHAKAYVSGLEKAMEQAVDKGIIFIDGSGPTPFRNLY